MGELMECMCQECGISHIIDLETISLEDFEGGGGKLVSNLFCSECGGQLVLNKKAGEEPNYRLK